MLSWVLLTQVRSSQARLHRLSTVYTDTIMSKPSCDIPTHYSALLLVILMYTTTQLST